MAKWRTISGESFTRNLDDPGGIRGYNLAPLSLAVGESVQVETIINADDFFGAGVIVADTDDPRSDAARFVVAFVDTADTVATFTADNVPDRRTGRGPAARGTGRSDYEVAATLRLTRVADSSWRAQVSRDNAATWSTVSTDIDYALTPSHAGVVSLGWYPSTGAAHVMWWNAKAGALA